MEMQVLNCILHKMARASTLPGNSELTRQLRTCNWNISQELKNVWTEKYAYWEIAPNFLPVHAEVYLRKIVNSKIAPTAKCLNK